MKELLRLAVSLVLLAAAGHAQQPPGVSLDDAPGWGVGVAITPRNFPSHTMREVDEAFALAAELGESSVFIYQWGSLDYQVAKLMVEKSHRAGLTPVLGLSPTTLDQGRKELDVPETVRRRAGAHLSFGNPVVRQAFRKAAEDLARLEPPFLCLATEINFLALQRLDEYLQFVSLYKEAYRGVKRVSPETRVFVSFQWEWMRIVDAREPHRIGEHRRVIDVFRPALDLIGLTTYPSPFHASPRKLPSDYYSWIDRHIEATDEVLLMEVGWPTAGTGSRREQADFIRRLPGLLEPLNVTIVAWALLHDVNLPQFDTDLRSVGLITRGGRRKPGYEAFKALR